MRLRDRVLYVAFCAVVEVVMVSQQLGWLYVPKPIQLVIPVLMLE